MTTSMAPGWTQEMRDADITFHRGTVALFGDVSNAPLMA
jgi:hypothetical protein